MRVFLFVLVPLLLVFAVYSGYRNGVDAQPKYYDGEGNIIPSVAIRALIHAQFVHTNRVEDSLIHKYFYFTP